MDVDLKKIIKNMSIFKLLRCYWAIANTRGVLDVYVLTLFRMGFFGAAHGWGGIKAPLPKICCRYPTMMKLGTVIPYLKEIQRIM